MDPKVQAGHPLSAPSGAGSEAGPWTPEGNEARWRRETLAALGGMAEEVAHQVRNPLGSIELMASLLLRDLADDRSRRRVERILGAVREIEARVSGLLSASWRYGFSLRPVPLHGLLGEIFQSSEAFRDGDETFLEVRYGPGNPDVRGDREMLRHLLVQLVLKALAGLPAGGRLVVETECPVSLPRDGEIISWAAVRFRFRRGKTDRPGGGIGEIFRRGNGGEGIFLAVVRNIVEAHRGIIRFDGEEGSGPSLVLCLPCVLGPETRPAPGNSTS